METTPKGTPVECHVSGMVSKYFAGAGNLTFPPDGSHVKNGQPRRLEWVLDPVVVETLVGPTLNKPGQVMFSVAKDLLQEGQEDALKNLVLKIAKEHFVTADRFNIAIEALQKQIVDLRKKQ